MEFAFSRSSYQCVGPAGIEGVQSGYVVAPDKRTEGFILTGQEGNIDLGRLDQWLDKHADKLIYEGAHIGGWLRPDGLYVLDVSLPLSRIEDAVTLGIRGDQDAIFHIESEN